MKNLIFVFLVAMALCFKLDLSTFYFLFYSLLFRFRIKAIILIYSGIIWFILYVQSIGLGIVCYGSVIGTNFYNLFVDLYVNWQLFICDNFYLFNYLFYLVIIFISIGYYLFSYQNYNLVTVVKSPLNLGEGGNSNKNNNNNNDADSFIYTVKKECGNKNFLVKFKNCNENVNGIVKQNDSNKIKDINLSTNSTKVRDKYSNDLGKLSMFRRIVCNFNNNRFRYYFVNFIIFNNPLLII